MNLPALTTDLLVAAQIRRCNDAGTPAFLVRRGDAERGTILLKLHRLEHGCEVWSQVRDMEGTLTWLPSITAAPGNDAAATEYVERAVKRDPDLWVVEVEDRAGVNPFLSL